MVKPIVYVSYSCPYCKKVMTFAEENNIELEYKDRSENEIREDLLRQTGKTQVPYLVDNNKNIKMHESDDIIAHLDTHYN